MYNWKYVYSILSWKVRKMNVQVYIFTWPACGCVHIQGIVNTAVITLMFNHVCLSQCYTTVYKLKYIIILIICQPYWLVFKNKVSVVLRIAKQLEQINSFIICDLRLKLDMQITKSSMYAVKRVFDWKSSLDVLYVCNPNEGC